MEGAREGVLISRIARLHKCKQAPLSADNRSMVVSVLSNPSPFVQEYAAEINNGEYATECICQKSIVIQLHLIISVYARRSCLLIINFS